ncbi:YdcF family protein [Jiella sp. M17.18]|uniref:YdcF family protein n=1 Tax=Jiella sp. M17.18 TaxID=3234247 RepID=UPI0034DE8765
MQPDVLADAERLWNFHRSVEPVAADARFDAVVGLGSYDEAVAHHAARLCLEGRAPVLLFTGRHGNWTAGRHETTEAERFRAVALADGVPAEAILIEPTATNIGENVSASDRLLIERGCRSALYVTKPQTQLRLHLTLRRIGRMPRFAVTAPARSLDDALQRFGERQILNEMVGDLDRVLAYPEMGFQAEIAVPAAVLEAFERLKAKGFRDHLLRRG